MKRIYYAHCMALYDTPQERRDEVQLTALGYSVLNPNRPEHQAGVERFKAAGKQGMFYFKDVVLSCDALAFRALPDGSIPSGVALEIEWAREAGMPVVELPSGVERRALTIEQTRAYLGEVGYR